jgi:hypothetical protein
MGLHTDVAQPRVASRSAVAASRPGQSKNPRLRKKSRLLDPIGASSSEATSRPERHGSVSESVRIRTICVRRRTQRSQLVLQALDIRRFFLWHAGCTTKWIQPRGHPMANRHRASEASSREWRSQGTPQPPPPAVRSCHSPPACNTTPLSLPRRVSTEEPAFMTDRFAAALCPPNGPSGGECVWSITVMQRRSVSALQCFTTPRPSRRPPKNTAPSWSAAPKEEPHPHSVLRQHSDMLSEDAECFTTI